MTRNRTLASLLLPALLLLLPAASPAQEPAIRIMVVPRLGVMAPSNDVLNVVDRLDAIGYRGSVARIVASPAVGLTLGVEAERYGIALRGTVLRSVLARADATGFMDRGPALAILAIWVGPLEYDHSLDAAVTQAALEATFDLHIGSETARPYVLAGIAAKRYDFGDPVPADTVGFRFPAGASGNAVQLGAGVRLRLLGRVLDLQVLDSYNLYNGRPQHDVFILAGVPLRIR